MRGNRELETGREAELFGRPERDLKTQDEDENEATRDLPESLLACDFLLFLPNFRFFDLSPRTACSLLLLAAAGALSRRLSPRHNNTQ